MDRKSSKVCQSFVPRDTFQTNMNTWKKEWKCWLTTHVLNQLESVLKMRPRSVIESSYIPFSSRDESGGVILSGEVSVCVCVWVPPGWNAAELKGPPFTHTLAHSAPPPSANQNQPIGSQKERIKVPLIDTLRRISSINTFTGQGGFVRKPCG